MANERISIQDQSLERYQSGDLAKGPPPINQTTFIQNNINVYGADTLEEVRDLKLADESTYSG